MTISHIKLSDFEVEEHIAAFLDMALDLSDDFVVYLLHGVGICAANLCNASKIDW